MSIQLAIIEKRLNNLEGAVAYLSESLQTAFPTAGIAFGSISDGLSEVYNEIEDYKADKIRAKRGDLFDRLTMISGTDLAFLVRQYAKALDESVTCERVWKHRNSSSLSSDVGYVFDMSNLSLTPIEFGISPNHVVSHKLEVLAVISGMSEGVDLKIRETATVDMETVTYVTKYDDKVHPLVAHRVINWFYAQIEQHLGSSAWCLPHPTHDKADQRNVTYSELRLRPVGPVLEEAIEAGRRLLRWADNNHAVSYGVALKSPKGKGSTSTVLQLIARRNAETGNLEVHLVDYDQDRFMQTRQDVNFVFDAEDVIGSEKYGDFAATVEALPLRRLARMYNLIRGIRFFEPTVTNSSLSSYEGTRYTVEYIEGNKIEVEE